MSSGPRTRPGTVALSVATGLTCALGLAACGNSAATVTSNEHQQVGPSTTGSKSSGRELAALDGVYVSDVSPAEVLSHGSPDLLDENFGHFVFVFDHGINVQGQESAHACTWSIHAVTDRGPGAIALPTMAAGGIAPNNANAKVGEPEETLHWTLHRGVLTLDPYSPDRWWIKPFHQVSRTPSLGWFSRRCPPPADALNRR